MLTFLFLLPLFFQRFLFSPHGYISSPGLFNCLVFTDFSSMQLVESYTAILIVNSGFQEEVLFQLFASDFQNSDF